jgi:DNA-binding NarL/FixJ family response regulator
MSKPVQTHIYCYDDHRSFFEDVKKRFSDTTRYIVTAVHNKDDLLKNLEERRDRRLCKVVIIGLHESKENFESAEQAIGDIKKIDISTGIILLVPPEKLDDAKKTVRFNVDSYIPRNNNSILRIHNTVKKLISEHSLLIFRKKRNISIYALFMFLVVSAIIVIIARFRFPLFF